MRKPNSATTGTACAPTTAISRIVSPQRSCRGFRIAANSASMSSPRKRTSSFTYATIDIVASPMCSRNPWFTAREVRSCPRLAISSNRACASVTPCLRTTHPRAVARYSRPRISPSPAPSSCVTPERSTDIDCIALVRTRAADASQCEVNAAASIRPIGRTQSTPASSVIEICAVAVSVTRSILPSLRKTWHALTSSR